MSAYDLYARRKADSKNDNRVGGSLIMVDPASNRTSGALLVTRTQ